MKARPDPRIDAYIAEAAEFARPILKHLRLLVRRAAPGAEETMKWNAPFWTHSGRILCSMAAFKAHCMFGFWDRRMNPVLGRDGARADTAMGDFGRITRREDLPSDAAMLRYIKAAAALAASGRPPTRPARKPKPEATVPRDLVVALANNRSARENFAAFSPSCRREYIEWIVDAKQPETRRRRLVTTVGWLAEGKKRNWQYEKC